MKFPIQPVVWVAGTVLLAGGAVAITRYLDIRKYSPEFNTTVRGKIERLGHYTFINPIIGCEIVGAGDEVHEYAPIKTAIQKVIDQKKSEQEITSASVYLRTLKTGRFISVNGDEPYSPASLLKVALMIAFYKTEDDHPGILSTTLANDLPNDLNQGENFKPLHPLQIGKRYSIEDLLAAMVQGSDNNAAFLLTTFLQSNYPNALSQVYDDLNIPAETAKSSDDFLSTRAYSSFFRVLFNATYLSRKSSEAALSLLSKSEFARGIEEGVPLSTTVAHKFGERTITNPDSTVAARELHDCGIIYYPDHPYFLCIMTKGKTFEGLTDAVAAITRISYNSLDDYFKKNLTSTPR